MGALVSHNYKAYFGEVDYTPDPESMPSFDPNFGFQEPREERVMVATQKEMADARVPMKLRDYCAHKYMAWMMCRRDHMPNIFACKHERHDWDQCEYDDWVHRMKEWERERRLLKRQQLKKRLAEEEE
ncbi:NADH dehydrogenase [ubiquinone] 1 beta subcomplex subunit 7-like [Branchiostoma lanceolatum]|uniref:NADH dehydrogenase [ubiquinone] 1 beta subcomplex subunit 7 n=1 Tax=Branchiostoma lanceolatum TaxID=7740 RepID=A0A8J9YY59_BRALA|nr:NDUFB7 [Branchiostoma lanceolatum]